MISIKDAPNLEPAMVDPQMTGDPDSDRNLISQLLLAKVQELRYLHITVVSISLAFGAFMIIRIIYDAWRAAQLKVRLRPRRFAFVSEISPAEHFPLILGFTIIIQQLFFVGVQSNSLSSVNTQDCKLSGELVYPAILLLGYLHLVFGTAMTIRALRNFRDYRYYKYSTPVAIVFVLLMIVLTVVSILSTKIDGRSCVAGVVWRATELRMVPPTVTLLSIFIIGFLFMAAIISLQLYRTVNLDPVYRVTASRMAYYLVANAIIYAFVLPFFIQVFTRTLNQDATSALVAEFAIFVSGAILGLLHFFLRANAGRTAIKPKEAPWQPQRRFRIFGPNDLEIINISAPLNHHPRPAALSWSEKYGDQYSSTMISPGRDTGKQPAVLSNLTFTPRSMEAAEAGRWPLPEGRLIIPGSPLRSAPIRPTNTSYSLFPGPEGLQLPPTVYTPASGSQSSPYVPSAPLITVNNPQGSLTSPSVTDIREASRTMGGVGSRLSRPWNGHFHRRGSSVDSCATVQIGIRLSNAPGVGGMHSSRYNSSQNATPPPRKNSVKPEPVQFLKPDVFTGSSSVINQRKISTSGQSVDLNAFSWPDKEMDVMLVDEEEDEEIEQLPKDQIPTAPGSKRRSLSPPIRLNTLVKPAKEIKSAGVQGSNEWL